MSKENTYTEVFKGHPNAEKLFETSDGQLFFTENHAANHARSLDDKAITVRNAKDSIKDVAEDAPPTAEAAKTAKKK